MAEVHDLKGIFSESGSLAGVIPDYDSRSQQMEMSDIIYRALLEGGHVLVEAGTGTGKTFAYLAPAILSGKKVIISTGTKALQEQLFYKDIPLIRKALPIRFFASYMKGRSNYLCLNRFIKFGALSLFDTPGEGRLFRRVQQWAVKTKTGDVADLYGVDENSQLWRRINSGVETCLGSKCPDIEKCFITQMRRAAAKADILIVNHHLFFADLSVKEKGYGEVIPSYDAVIFDEAHLIEDVATHYFGCQVSNYRIGELIRDTRHGLRELKDAKGAGRIEQICVELEGKSTDYFSAFPHGPEKMRLLRENMDGALILKGSQVILVLDRLQGELLGAAADGEALASCTRRAGEISSDLQQIMETSDPEMVYWREVRGKGVFLHASPIDVSNDLAERVFSKVFCAVLTSATLTAGGSFEFIKKRLGMKDAAERSFPSPFDYASQVILYIPDMKSEPDGSGFVEEASNHIREILERTRGRALILFTSYRHMHAVYELLQGKIEYPILKQGDDSRDALLSRFRKETESVLLATRSFWQGIDVQGEALSCVIIDKLPFASPSDPVVASRIDSIRRRGGDPFYEYQLPEAVITLKQGFGRLIRNKKDRGVLSIMDRRIRSRSYGKVFMRSLPRCPVTYNVEGIEKVFTPQNDKNSK
ncbi:MAG: helicase C-terminal domain-containing protein [bacterium]